MGTQFAKANDSAREGREGFLGSEVPNVLYSDMTGGGISKNSCHVHITGFRNSCRSVFFLWNLVVRGGEKTPFPPLNSPSSVADGGKGRGGASPAPHKNDNLSDLIGSYYSL